MIKILVPTDFSPCANNALDYAIEFAKNFEAEITLLHGFESNDPNIAELRTKIERDAFEQAENKLSHLKESLLVRAPKIACKTELIIGYARNSILHLCNTQEFNLIIMGSHGASRAIAIEGTPIVIESLYGSVSSGLIGDITTPLLIVHKDNLYKKISKVNLLSDMQLMPSNDSYHFVNFLTTGFEADVKITHIENKKRLVSEVLKEISNQEANLTNHKIEYAIIQDENLEDTILNMQNSEDELLTIVTKEKSLLKKLFAVSHSKELADEYKKPILILPEYISYRAKA